MSNKLDKYLPEFDEDELRAKLAGRNLQEVTEMLIDSYKEKRLVAKMLDAETKKLTRIEQIIAEPTLLLGMPGIPNDDEIRRMTDKDEK